jgi:hypothetical protein
MALLRAGAFLPDTIEPYLALMIGGFVIAVYGHLAKARWLVAIGIIMIFLATLLFPLALQFFADEPPPPGPKVPIALLTG